MGLSNPKTFVIWAIEIILVLSLIALITFSTVKRPSSSKSIYLTTLPVCLLTSNHGNVFEACSAKVIKISSPSFKCVKPYPNATKFNPSVDPYV